MLRSFYSLIILFHICQICFAQQRENSTENIDDFLEFQPIIDMHFHITKGFEENEKYAGSNENLDAAKLNWVIEDYLNNNVVLVMGGGTLKYAQMYAEASDLFWAGVVFPCSKTVKQDEPCTKEFYSEEELRQIYRNGDLKSMGESMYNYYGIPPTDPRLEAYWKVAEEFGIPIGIHADSGPPIDRVDKTERPNYSPQYADPSLLKPILEKYPELKVYLMHFGGEYSENGIQLMKTYNQIYCEISAVSMFMPKHVWEPNVKKLYEEGLGSRLMFASDYFGTVRKNIEIIYNLDWLSEQQKRDVYYDNAARFLGLTESQRQRHLESIK